MSKSQKRRDVRGRFSKMTEADLAPVNVSAEDVLVGAERPRHAPAADDLAGQPYPGPLRPRTARLVPPDDGTTEVYAAPRPETLRADVTTGEDGRPLAAELTYLTGEVSSWPQMRRIEPLPAHPDDAGHHNGLMRTAARSSGPMDPAPFLTGLDGPETPAGSPESHVTAYGDGRGTMSPRRAQDVAPGRYRRRSDGH